MNDCKPSRRPLRTDPLTGVHDQTSFYEWFLAGRERDPDTPFTLVAFDLNHFKEVNIQHGLAVGDEALQWAARIMREETAAPVYRIGGDEFVVVLAGEDEESHTALAQDILERLNREGTRFHLKPPVTKVAVIHFQQGHQSSGGSVIDEIFVALAAIKAEPLPPLRTFVPRQIQPEQALRRLVQGLLNQLEQLAVRLDEMQRLAYTDALTGLPNVRAAVEALELALSKAAADNEPLAILLIDGDDLHRYNEISYAAGDEMICNLAAVQQSQLRPADFIARWRMGDEFLAILSATSAEEGLAIAKRILSAVERESRDWPLPVTVSAGLAAYPDDGGTLGQLLYQAERAKQKAKQRGKNQVATPD